MKRNTKRLLALFLTAALTVTPISAVRAQDSGESGESIRTEEVAVAEEPAIQEENPVVLSGWQFVIGGLIMIGCGLVAGGRLAMWTGGGVAMLVYLAMISAVAYSLWGILLKYNPVSRVAVFGFMNPVFGVILSALLLNETGSLGSMSLAALVLVCVGIYVVNVQPKTEL